MRCGFVTYCFNSFQAAYSFALAKASPVPVCRTFPFSPPSKCRKDRGLGVKNACTLCHYKMVLHKGSRKLAGHLD